MQVYQFPGRTISDGTSDFLYFGGTSYLGLSQNPEFLTILTENLRRWGASYGSSRNANVQLAVYEEAEQTLSHWVGSEAAVTVTSGTLAGWMALKIYEKTHAFCHIRGTHPAVVQRNSREITETEWVDLPPQKSIVTTDSFLSNRTVPTNFERLSNMASAKLIVDDSHGLGFTGKEGSGIYTSLTAIPAEQKIMVASLGKAMGLPGGIICGSKKLIEKIKNSEEFVTASGMLPAYLQTFIDAQNLYILQRQKLQELLDYFVTEMGEALSFYNFSGNYPVIYSDKEELANFLYQKKIMIVNFDYPSPGKKLNRIVLSAHHNAEDVRKLAAALKEFVKF
ncbi:MAG: aminotransferase class I/II-fold pyridoxal phosphate-dependent enzyme [Flavobacteriaceae bacterium]|nr:aminotransferase class I/II-fold pyridoxal phosphate-dependent enzyme [Flavobacteriaceae bacterium]